MTKGGADQRGQTIAVASGGAVADAWVRALRGIDGVCAERLSGTGEDEALATFARRDISGVAFGARTPDLPGAIKRAVMVDRDVIVTGPVALSSKQLVAIDELAQRRSRVIMFDTGNLGDERLAFVRKTTGGAHPLWRARYLRSLRTGASGDATLDELAIADVATALFLLGETPSAVSAYAPRIDDESGAADAVMLTLSYDHGPIASIDISLIEPVMRQEIIIACDGRSLALDALDARAPLQIQASARHRGPRHDGQWAETITEHPLADTGDRTARAAALFVQAMRKRDLAATNARALAQAARVWEMARTSLARGGEQISLSTERDLAGAARPALQIIHGGGHRAAAGPPPALRLVGRR